MPIVHPQDLPSYTRQLTQEHHIPAISMALWKGGSFIKRPPASLISTPVLKPPPILFFKLVPSPKSSQRKEGSGTFKKGFNIVMDEV